MAAEKSINIKGGVYEFNSPKVMAVINLTPDSFFEGSRYNLQAAKTADIVDIGSCSTRPGSEPVSEEEELARLHEYMPELKTLYGEMPVSIDTFRPEVAKQMLETYGVDIINDVSGGDLAMYEVCAAYKAVYVLTWSRGGGVEDMLMFFSEKLDALYRAGVNDVILDPGFGFGKDIAQNYEIARNLKVLDEFKLPVLVGISRKRMLWQLLNSSPEESLNATTALNSMLLERGANIIRVHDVEQAQELVTIYKQFHNN